MDFTYYIWWFLSPIIIIIFTTLCNTTTIGKNIKQTCKYYRQAHQEEPSTQREIWERVGKIRRAREVCSDSGKARKEIS